MYRVNMLMIIVKTVSQI